MKQRDFDKVFITIRGCKTMAHLDTAKRMVEQFHKVHKGEEGIDILKNRLTCMLVYKIETINLV